MPGSTPLQERVEVSTGSTREEDTAKYTSLTGAALSAKLAELANPSTAIDTDHVTLQPCTNADEASQDRFTVQDWDIKGGVWRLRAVFDGHSGHEMVDYTVEQLPALIERRLRAFLDTKLDYATSDISDILKQSISSFDEGITSALLDLFPGDSIHSLSDGEIDTIIHDETNLPIVLRCMRGTTALVALTNPAKTDLWVASLGDCRAVLGTKSSSGLWSAKELSYNHNGMNPSEVQKIAQEHPEESRVVENERVLGSIAVTRAIGDHVFKLPPVYTRRAFLRCKEGFRTTMKKVEDIVSRVLTPPYVSNAAEVSHSTLDCGEGQEVVLFLFSDGLFDLYEMVNRFIVSMPGFWTYVVRTALADAQPGDNFALKLLRHALGADNEDTVSFWLTLESDTSWMDDTTVLAQRM